MRPVTVAQRRARLGLRHCLAPAARAGGPGEVAERMVALHSTDPSSVYQAVWARTAATDTAAVQRALYEDRTLLRMLGMRRTVFVVTRDVAPVVQAACSAAIGARERRKLLGWLAESGIAAEENAERWLKDVERVALEALAARGEATAAELAADDPRLAAQIVLARGKSYEGRQNVASRVLFLLAADGEVVRGRPRGGWTSHQYRWVTTRQWCGEDLPERARADAEVELARRWLHTFGPASPADLQWWAGWSAGQVKRVLGRLRPVEVDLDGTAGVVAADDLDPVPAPEPWAALLPALDSTPMGAKQREWFLGGHGPKLFDRFGNAGPTVWWDGRVVGGWAQRTGGEIAFRLLEDIGADATAAVEATATRLQDQLADVRLTARTRGVTAVERELLG